MVVRLLFAGMLTACLQLSSSNAQVDLSAPFIRQLEAVGLEFLEPLEARYRDVPVFQNDLLSYDFAIRSRRERLEIRYFLEAVPPPHAETFVPHLHAIRMLTHLASNDEEQVMTGLDIPTSDLSGQFNADWGKVFFFTPKEGFSSRYPSCKMLTLFREGRGMAYVFFLFDDPANSALDKRFYALRFLD